MRTERTESTKPTRATKKPAPPADNQARLEAGRKPVNPDQGVWVLEPPTASRKALCKQLTAHGYQAQAMDSVEQLLDTSLPTSPTCLLVRIPLSCGSSAADLIGQLKHKGLVLPVVVIASDWNLKLAVDTMKAGAMNFLAAPAEPDALLDALEDALSQANTLLNHQQCVDDAQKRLATLNARETEILKLVLTGLLNKEIADQLNLALVTVKVYRARVMKKLGAGNAASMACIANLGGMNVQSSGLPFSES